MTGETGIGAGPADGVSFATVLVPLDGSATGESVLPTANELARRFGARLVLLHVVPYPEPAGVRPSHGTGLLSRSDVPSDVAEAAAEAQVYLEAVARSVGGAEALVRIGDPFTRIRQEARALEPAMVVLTAKATAAAAMGEHSELARRLAFSRIAPVLVVPQPDPRP